MKILDCSLRDGGYYTQWDFSIELVDTYIKSMENLPIEYIEIGYRSNHKEVYLGEYFYLPVYVMERIKSQTNKKLAIILDEKDVSVDDVEYLLGPCVSLIDMVRIAIDPKNFERALGLAREVKKMGFELGFNVMYMSKWKEFPEFIALLSKVDGLADYFYMVDSYGGVYPQDVKDTIALVRQKIATPLGFHGHNNLELGLINTLTAIEEGVEIIDATVTGIGRGAGNLKTELLLTALNAKGQLEFDYNVISKVVDAFSQLQKEYEWGTNLPYMVSGANSLPQKDVMDWVSKRYYSFNSIIRALQNQHQGIEDNQKLPIFKKNITSMKAIIVGGGDSVKNHAEAIKTIIGNNPEIIIIHASSKNAMVFNQFSNSQIFCLVGNEGHRMEQVFNGNVPEKAICVLPPFPRKMGTYIPEKMMQLAYELESNHFTEKFIDSHTAIALQVILDLGIENFYVVGYDGYSKGDLDEKSTELLAENDYLFNAVKAKGIEGVSLTPTIYNSLTTKSIYSLI